MNQAKYAKRLGISRSKVCKLVKAGVIPIHDGDINPEEADKAYHKYAHPAYDHNRRARLPLDDVKEASGSEATDSQAVPSQTTDQRTEEHRQFKKSAASEKEAKSRIAWLEYGQRSGQLADAKEVEANAFQTYRDVRDALINIPNRIAGAIAAELGLDSGKGQEQIFTIMNREITDALKLVSHAASEP